MVRTKRVSAYNQWGWATGVEPWESNTREQPGGWTRGNRCALSHTRSQQPPADTGSAPLCQYSLAPPLQLSTQEIPKILKKKSVFEKKKIDCHAPFWIAISNIVLI